MRPIHRFFLFLFLVCLGVFLYSYIQRRNHSFFPRLGDHSLSESQLEFRLDQIEKRLSDDPNNLKLLVDRGIVYFLKGEEHYADALNNFSAAWQAGALDKRIFYYSGILYEHLSLLDEAERQYRRFLRHEPESREIRLRLARLVFNAGKWEEAIQEYQAWLEEHPEDLTALINCGVAYQEMARKVFSDRKASKQEENAKMSSWVQEGSHYLEKAIQLEPDLPEGVYLSLGRLYYYDGKYEPSAQACEKEVLKNPESSEALKVLVLNYNKLKEDEKELETYLKLSKKFPKDESYKRHIIRLQKRVASSKKL